MKYYLFILLPEKSQSIEIQDFRERYTGQRLIDGLPPHITIIGRFSRHNSVSVEDLKHLAIDGFDLPEMTITFDATERLGNAIVRESHDESLKQKHLELLSIVSDSVNILHPDRQGANYRPHLTLLRDPNSEYDLDKEEFLIKKITLTSLALYSIEQDQDAKLHSGEQLAVKYLNNNS